jgi:hypothetical protein
MAYSAFGSLKSGIHESIAVISCVRFPARSNISPTDPRDEDRSQTQLCCRTATQKGSSHEPMARAR